MSQLAQEALDLVDKLDSAVVGMLDTTLGSHANGAGGHLKSLQHLAAFLRHRVLMHCADSSTPAQDFAQAAGQLETLLLQLRQRQLGGSQEQQLQAVS
jgi:hypothetical protein